MTAEHAVPLNGDDRFATAGSTGQRNKRINWHNTYRLTDAIDRSRHQDGGGILAFK